MDKPKSEIRGLYRTEVVAKMFGVSVRRIQQLVQEGIIHTTETGGTRAFDLTEVTKEYVQYLYDKATGREVTADLNQLKEQKLRAEIALKESQGELHEMRNEIARGNYLEREVVKLDYGRFFLAFKKFALSIPSRVAGNLSGRLEPLEVRAVEKDLQEEITKLLNAFVVAGTEDGDTSATVKITKRGRPRKK